MRAVAGFVGATLPIAAAYTCAAAVEAVLYFEWTGGHADVPFTTFPDYLVVAPVVPALVLEGLLSRPRAVHVASTLVFLIAFGATFFGIELARARSRTRAAAARMRARRAARPPAVVEFDREALVRRLGAIAPRDRLLFGAVVAERLFPAAEAFFRARDPARVERLRGALELLWERGTGEGVEPALAACEAAVGVAAEADTEASLHAENAAAALAYGLAALRSGDAANLGWAAQRAYDTVDHHASSREAGSAGPRDEEAILAHPAVQRELARQLEDVEEVEALGRRARGDGAEAARLRERARAQAGSVLA